jgi:putative MATE family efflux protein
MGVIAFAVGVGVGGSSAISRKIGAKNKDMADSAAVHTVVIDLLVGIALTVSLFPFLKQIFLSTGARGRVISMVLSYSRILVAEATVIVFTNVGTGILRGEGDTKRAMYAMILGSGLNIILDPVFIYTFKMGVEGAAWATLISMCITAILLYFWLFVKKDTYVNIKFTLSRFNKSITKEILRVGVPSSFAQLSMSLSMFILNAVIVKVAGTDGIAVFTSTWRIILFGIIPLLGIAIGVTAVTGAAYGARDVEKLNTGYLYGIKIGFLMEVAVAVLILVFAHPLAFLFTYSKSAASIFSSLVTAFRTLVWFLPTVPFGMLTSSMFQGIGKGENSLAVTVFRTLIMQVFFAYIFGVTLQFGLVGVWWGIVLGNVIASFVSFLWGRLAIKALQKQIKENKVTNTDTV